MCLQYVGCSVLRMVLANWVSYGGCHQRQGRSEWHRSIHLNSPSPTDRQPYVLCMYRHSHIHIYILFNVTKQCAATLWRSHPRRNLPLCNGWQFFLQTILTSRLFFRLCAREAYAIVSRPRCYHKHLLSSCLLLDHSPSSLQVQVPRWSEFLPPSSRDRGELKESQQQSVNRICSAKCNYIH